MMINPMNQTVVIGAAFVAGLAGGFVGARLNSIGTETPSKVVRARSFELVNEKGQAISFWGIDRTGSLVLAFGRRPDNIVEVEGAIPPGQYPPGLENPENQLTAIGLEPDDTSALWMRSWDGKLRMRMTVNVWAQPSLLMQDAISGRVFLGVEQSDTPGPQDSNHWCLSFPPTGVRIGSSTEKADGVTYVRGQFYNDQERVRYSVP